MSQGKTLTENLLTTAAVADWLGISPRTVCLWAECREIPARKVGRQWRFRENEIWGWLRRREEKNGVFEEKKSLVSSMG